MTDISPLDSARVPLVVGAETAGDDAPAVVAVLVITRADDDLGLTLDSLAAQDYSNFGVLVIDAGPVAVADQVAERMPGALVHRLAGEPGFAAAANQSLDLVTGGSFFLFCSIGVDLGPDCVSLLVEELYRSNAGIVTPKYVQWADPRRLAAMGMGSDRFGVQVDLVEPGDFDQEQYDAVRDVFVAPTGVQLVRSDLFRTLKGFDVVMESVGQDLDLCWRAQVLGARVVAVPSAVARVKPVPPESDGSAERRRLLGRNGLRSLLVTASRFSLFRVVPIAVLLLVLEGLYSLLAGRRRQAADAFTAIGWNLSRWGDSRSRRQQLHELRQVSDRGVHDLQVGGSARLNAFFRGQFSVGDRLVGLAGSIRDSFSGQDSGSLRDGTITGALVALFILIGSRDLITDGVTPVGQFLDLPSAGLLLEEWFGGWRSAGTGGPGNPSTAFLVLGVLKTGFFWADGLLDLLLVLVLIVGGTVGAWRLVRPLASPRASGLAALAYIGNPLLVAMISAGRWDSLVVWGVSPFLLGSLLRVQGVAPYGRTRGHPGPTVVDRDLPTRLLRFGLLVAAAATFVPAVILVAVALALALALGAVLVLRPLGLRRLGAAAVVAIVAPGALHGPWTFDVVRRFRWQWFVGPPSPGASFDSLADLVRFAPGIEGPGVLVIGLLLAALLPLLIGRSTRFDLGGQAWAVALVFFGLAWVGRRGWAPMALPTAELLLAPAAAGLALAVGAGVRAIDVDLVGYRFGWRQVAAFTGLVALVGSGLILIQSSVDGRWGLPEQSYSSSTSLLAEQYDGPSRVLWLGAPSVLPIDALESPGGSYYALSDGGTADVRSRWVPDAYGVDHRIGRRLDLASAEETSRLGRLLAPYGIDLIVVLPQLAPAPYQGPQRDPGGRIVEALGRQLDLQRVSGTPDLIVYRNTAAQGPVVALADQELPVEGDALTQLNTDLSSGVRVMAESPGPGEWQASEPPAGEILVAVPAEGWVSEDEQARFSTAFDGLLAVRPGPGSDLAISYPAPLSRRLALVAQLVLIACGVALARSRRQVRS